MAVAALNTWAQRVSPRELETHDEWQLVHPIANTLDQCLGGRITMAKFDYFIAGRQYSPMLTFVADGRMVVIGGFGDFKKQPKALIYEKEDTAAVLVKELSVPQPESIAVAVVAWFIGKDVQPKTQFMGTRKEMASIEKGFYDDSAKSTCSIL